MYSLSAITRNEIRACGSIISIHFLDVLLMCILDLVDLIVIWRHSQKTRRRRHCAERRTFYLPVTATYRVLGSACCPLSNQLKLHSDIISPFKRILEKSMYTMTDIWLLVYFLPHVSLCGFIRYLIKYKFATNNGSGISQRWIYFYHRNSPVNESKRWGKLKGGSTYPR